jgi:hypothetical protein
LKNRSEKVAVREQILPFLQVNSHSIDQKSGEIWAAQALLQPISFKPDRLLGGSSKAFGVHSSRESSIMGSYPCNSWNETP